ncbi:MAG: hypothetical protein OEL77_03175 [Nitrosopumilus sp.]|nr:hypothetical protein [Nitrosopumilus sp.]MDH3384998.1 hypothetical protein [Nitrosopumilus sp.]
MSIYCQTISGIMNKLISSSRAYMIGPIGFILTGIAALLSLFAYFQ